MTLIDMFLFIWGGMDSVMIRSEFYKESWDGYLWKGGVMDAMSGGIQFL
ncbi:hypothetical protein PEC301937_03950 [Pectobacterium carotovorum subsp. carotovorum]|nr:hypothetical protein PEC301937_03950 [Pectobacterium carotovorum subsp. carotovorum]